MVLNMHATKNNLAGMWENTRVTNFKTRFRIKLGVESLKLGFLVNVLFFAVSEW